MNTSFFSTYSIPRNTLIFGVKSNHLGNVLNVITDRKLPINNPQTNKVDYYTADVVSYSDYTPFGALLEGRHGYEGKKSSHGFQGQLTDDEVKGEGNSVNYKYRMHDPRLGRFFAVDPLASKYPFYSPYSFSGNQVIHMVELEGLEPAEPGSKEGEKKNAEYISCPGSNYEWTWSSNTTSNNSNGGLWVIGKCIKEGKCSAPKVVNPFDAPEPKPTESSTTPNQSNTSGDNPSWLNTAYSQLGVTRDPVGSNSKIEEYLKTTTYPAAAINDNVAWCAGFVSWCLEGNELKSTNSALAFSYSDYGQTLKQPALGAIVVMSCSHVAFVAGVTKDGRIVLLGGNQGNPEHPKNSSYNAVTLSPNKKSAVQSYHYPTGMTPNYNLPVLNVSGSSLNYNSTH